jgi:hypothetical protein
MGKRRFLSRSARSAAAPKEIDLLQDVWSHFSEGAAEQGICHHHVIHFALAELERNMAQFGEYETRKKLRQYIDEIDAHRS